MNALQLNLLFPGILEALKTQLLPTHGPSVYQAREMPYMSRRPFRVCWYGSAGSDRRVVDVFSGLQPIVGYSPAVYFFTDTCFFEEFDYADTRYAPLLHGCYCATAGGDRPVRAYVFPGGELGIDIGTSDQSFEDSVIKLGLKIDIACHAGGMAGPGPTNLAALKTEYSLGRTPRWSGEWRRSDNLGDKPFGSRVVREVKWGLSHAPDEITELRRVLIPRRKKFKNMSDTVAELFHPPSYGAELDLNMLKELSPSAAARFATAGLSLLLDELRHLEGAAAAELMKTQHSLRLSGLGSLDENSARHLSEIKGDLYLDGLRQIPPVIAEILSKKAGFLSLSGFHELTPELAKILAQHKGTLALNGVRILSEAAVKFMMSHEGQLQFTALNQIKELHGIQLERIPSLLLGHSWRGDISAEAAKVLARVDNAHLELKCSIQPPDDALRLLAGFKGSIRFGPELEATARMVSILAQGPAEVSFENVPQWRHLEEIHARILTANRWEYRVNLASVYSLSDAAAARLLKVGRHYQRTRGISQWLLTRNFLGENQAKFLLEIACTERHPELTFPNLTSLSQQVAATLAASRRCLRFPALQAVGTDAAVALSTSTAALSLPGILDVSTEAAEAFAAYRGDLNLDGITNLGVEVAKRLAKHSGLLSLAGIRTLSPEAAEALRFHQGPILWHRLDVTHPSVARCMVACRKGPLHLDLLETLTPEKAAILAEARCDLSLNGLTELTDSCAQALSQHRGPLRLKGLTRLTAESAAALGRHRGPLYLSGIRMLGPECASGLSRHTGALYLNGLRHLDHESSVALSTFTGPLYMKNLVDLSPECRRVLNAKPGYQPKLPKARTEAGSNNNCVLPNFR